MTEPNEQDHEAVLVAAHESIRSGYTVGQPEGRLPFAHALAASRESAERETGKVIADLRRKLAEAGVEGSPPAEETTIGALLVRARTGERERDELREAFSATCCAALAEATAGFSDAAIVGGGPFNETHALNAVRKCAAVSREWQAHAERLRAALNPLGAERAP